jgi:hypothetical protein
VRVRRVRRRPLTARDGDLVVDARIHARLLGMPLLAIDARIVVAPARPALTVPARPIPILSRSPDGDRSAAVPELARALRLIAEGSSLLDEASRLH